MGKKGGGRWGGREGRGGEEGRGKEVGGERKRNGVGGNEAEGLETVHQVPYQLRASHSKGGADGDLTYLGVPLGSNTIFGTLRMPPLVRAK